MRHDGSSTQTGQRSVIDGPKRWGVLLLMCVTLTGCAGGLEFAAIGAAANATQAGTAVVKGGKINGALLVPADEVVAAVKLAMEDAGLTIRDVDTQRAFRTEIVAVDDRGARVKVRVRERTDTLSRVQVDMGWFGDAATARLIAVRVSRHLRSHDGSDNAVEFDS